MNEQNIKVGGEPITRRLKKVKRPIKRMVPKAQVNPAVPNNKTSQNNPDINAFDLDSIFNEDNNLPTPYMSNEGMSGKPSKNVQPQLHFAEEDEDNLVPTKPTLLEMIRNNAFNKGTVIIIACVSLFLGIVIAKLIFSEEKVVRDGLQGVVVNNEVPRGRARCGVAEKTQGCVLYIMNPQRQELNASDFYDLASQLTGRQRFVIETGNMRYSNHKIRPGEIAQFNIPPLQ